MPGTNGRAVWRAVTVFVVAALTAMLSACATGDESGSSVFDRMMNADLSAKPQQPVRGIAASAHSGTAPPAQVYYGTGGGVASPGAVAAARSGATGGPGAQAAGGDTYDLSFENADVTTVAKVLIGDVLGATYVIDPRVEGTISLSSARPVPRRDVLPLLEAALKLNGAIIVDTGGSYQITLAGESGGSGGAVDVGRRRASPGYGLSVLPLENVSADTVTRLIEGFGAPAGTVKVDPTRNLLLVQGTAEERNTIMDTALAFDVDWMRGQSVGIFPLQNSSPEVVITELTRLTDSASGGLGAGLVRFQPITRLNAVLAISAKPSYIQQVGTWIRRLDQADQENARLRVYRVQHGDARRIAAILNSVFAGGAGDTSGTTPGGDLGAVSPDEPASTGSSFGDTGGSAFASTGQTGSSGGIGSSANAGGSTQGNGPLGDDPTGSESPFGGAASQPADATGPAGPSGPPVLQNVRITADVANNSILIYADRDSYRIIERALADIDRPGLQVAIEAMIAEVTLNGELSYGVQYYLRSEDVGLPANEGSISFFDGTSTKKIAPTAPGFNLVLGPKGSPRVILDALRKVTDVKVLSSPSLVVIDNQTATLQVGNEVPVTTRSSQSTIDPDSPTVNEVEYKNTGVILRVTPRVSANGVVNLDVEQEISSVVNNSSEDTLTPTISQRRVKSQVAVNNGQTVVLAGLIQEQTERNKQGIPIISEVPYIGNLLSNTTIKRDRTELVIFIKPLIIRDGLDAQMIAEELRLKLIGGVRP